jgi:hypothetical protein
VCLEGRGDLVAYAKVFDQLRAFAHSPAQSALLAAATGRGTLQPAA